MGIGDHGRKGKNSCTCLTTTKRYNYATTQAFPVTPVRSHHRCTLLSARLLHTDTKHPIVLVHGVSGFDTVGGLVNYFHTVPWQLERSGATVHTASVSFVNNSWTRGEQLRNYLYTLPGQKFNLIGHSQGAPTSRVTAHLVPQKVASVTSVNGVNKGSKVADVVRGILPPNSSIEGGVSAIAEALGGLINALTGSDNPQDGVAALETLTTPGTNAINEATQWRGVNRGSCAGTRETYTINGNPVRYFSWGGSGQWTSALMRRTPSWPQPAWCLVGRKRWPGEHLLPETGQRHRHSLPHESY